MKEKTFYRILLEFSQNPEKSKNQLADKRLSLIEKKIIDGYLQIRNNKNHEVIDSMSIDTPVESPFVESQRLLLSGCAYNNISHYAQAETYLRSSIKILKEIDAPYFHFFAYFVLFWIKANLNETKDMAIMLKEMQKIPVASEHQSMRLLRCQFCYLQMIENNDEAYKVMRQLDGITSSLSESDAIHYLSDKFIFLMQVEDFVQGHEVLNQMKNYRKYHVSENFRFNKKLLDHLTQDSAIYAYDKDFQDVPLLLYQIKFIQALEENDLESAQQYWNHLSQISAGAYLADYHYAGSKCLFSLCLEKHRHKLVHPKQIKVGTHESPISALIDILQKAQAPLPAALIYEMVFGKTAEDKADLVKLSRLVYRAKNEKGLDVVFRKGTYFMAKKSALKVS